VFPGNILGLSWKPDGWSFWTSEVFLKKNKAKALPILLIKKNL
jgi:hypothetical protein